MKMIPVSLILAVAVSASVFATEEMTAEQVVAQCYNLYRQAQDETEEISATVTHDDGRKDEKKFIRWLRFSEDGEDKVAIRFSEPKLDDGLGLLIFRHRGGKDEQWLRLAGEKSVRKVAIRDQGKYFAGMDLTYEDARQLVGERTEDFTYRFLPEPDSSEEVWMIEAVPKPDTKTVYSRRIFQIARDTFACNRIEYYGRHDKVQFNHNISFGENGRWRTSRIVIENSALKRTTEMIVTERNFDALDDFSFTTAKMVQGR